MQFNISSWAPYVNPCVIKCDQKRIALPIRCRPCAKKSFLQDSNSPGVFLLRIAAPSDIVIPIKGAWSARRWNRGIIKTMEIPKPSRAFGYLNSKFCPAGVVPDEREPEYGGGHQKQSAFSRSFRTSNSERTSVRLSYSRLRCNIPGFQVGGRSLCSSGSGVWFPRCGPTASPWRLLDRSNCYGCLRQECRQRGSA